MLAAIEKGFTRVEFYTSFRGLERFGSRTKKNALLTFYALSVLQNNPPHIGTVSPN